MGDRLDKIIETEKKLVIECDGKCGTCEFNEECTPINGLERPTEEFLSSLISLGYIKEEPCIQLKNLDLTGYSEHEQVSKYLEESNELIKVILDKDSDSTFEHFCEEMFDQLQVCIGIAEKKYQKSADDVMKEYAKHILKMEQRGNKPREGTR